MAKKFDTQALTNFLAQVDHHQIYKLHMAQARDALKQFKGDADKTAKVQAIMVKIRDTYEQACANEQGEA
jgi:hypothetical protein